MNPGSDEAINAGCACPVLDNAHGRGRPGRNGERQFWMSSDCPIHGDGAPIPYRLTAAGEQALREME